VTAKLKARPHHGVTGGKDGSPGKSLSASATVISLPVHATMKGGDLMRGFFFVYILVSESPADITPG
jgi:hypothetical protein